MKTHLPFILFIIILSGCKKESDNSRKASIPDQTEINKLKINQLQTLGSHNSYHIRTDPKLLNFLSAISSILPSNLQASDLDYEHESLEIQLNTYGMRSFEIDIYADPVGGRFYSRRGNILIGKPEASGIDELRQPGFKVMHIPDIDYNTHFYTFKSMLLALKSWSDTHPNHIPVFLLIETKETTAGDILGFLGFKTAIKYTPALCDDLDAEVKAVFGNNLDKVITPDMIRASYPTLEAAVLANNWPTVGESRGKFIFVMQGGGEEEYIQGHASLQGRTMFIMSEQGKPEAAFLGYDDPTRNSSIIPTAVSKGYMVRTRSDDPNKQNRTGDYTQQNAAFVSGAQMISTDYYRPDPRYLTQPATFKNYSCRFPNNDLARINPVSAADKQGIGKIAE